MSDKESGASEASSGAWEELEAFGRSAETNLAESFAEPGQAEKCQAMLDLLCAIRADNAKEARQAEERLTRAGVSPSERESVAYMPIAEMGKAGAELSRWMCESPWLAARDRAIAAGKSGWAKSATEEMSAQMAASSNSRGLDEMIKAGAMSLAEAFEVSCSYRDAKLFARYGEALLQSAAPPPASSVARLCKMAPSLFQQGFAPSDYPLDRFFKAWAPLMSSEQRCQMWADAISYANARLAASLGRCGIEPKDWVLEGSRLHVAADQTIDNPRALDFALHQRRNWRVGDGFLKALMSIEAVSEQRDQTHPYALMGMSNTDLESVAKLGIRIDGVDARGKNTLHLALERPYYSRPGMPFLLASAKRFPELWAREDGAGKTPLDLLKPDELKKVEQALSAGEKTALSRELAGRRGARVKRRPGL